MEQDLSGAIIEGVGNDVLLGFGLALIVVLLSLAWSSTNLTNSQARLSPVRIQRSNVELNRHINSSTTDPVPSQTTILRAQRSDNVDEENVATNDQSDNLARDLSEEINSITAENGSNTETLNSAAGDLLHRDSDDSDSSDELTENIPGANAGVEKPSKKDSVSSAEGDLSDKKKLVASESNSDTVLGSEESTQPSDTEDTIQIRLKFIDDNERLTRAKVTDTVQDFIRCNFAAELSSNKLIRLICNGQVLQEQRTLQHYNIINNMAIHALINDSVNRDEPPTRPTPDTPMLETGNLMVPLFAFMLCILWYLRYDHAELFNITSTISLIGITSVFICCFIAQRRSGPPTNLDTRRNIHVNTQIRSTNE